ncbi:MAG: TetR/AcrR family transcriptional regulator [Actinomycetes bacterium]
MSDRRDELLEHAVDYALVHGIGSLTLRPLARALGTSDRMLVYHFGGKDQLVDSVLSRAYDRWFHELDRRPRTARSPRAAVRRLWAAVTSAPLAPCMRLYLEVAALSMYDPTRYRSVNTWMTDRWRAAIVEWLVAAGADPTRARAAAPLVAAALDGLHVELIVTGDARPLAPAVRRLADWAEAETRPATRVPSATTAASASPSRR